MKPFKYILAAGLVAAGFLMAANPAQAVRPGTTAPDFTLQDAEGNAVTLSSFKGRVVVLDWANYQCPYDKMHYESGNIPNLQKEFAAQDVVWLTVHSSAPGEQGYHAADDMKKENARVSNAATHVLLDAEGTVGRLYEAKTTPQIYVIDKEGVVQYNGAIDSIKSSDAETLATAVPYASNAIKAVIAGNKPEPAATVPYGCSVKYAN